MHLCHGSPRSRRSFGTTPRGHFEQLESRELLSVSSDAPSPYPAASVSSSIGPVLGASRIADDGLVTVGSLWVGRLDAELALNVSQVTGTGALLDAWIDFDQDGSFGGAAEQILDSVSVTNGTQVFAFDVPSIAEEGDTWIRFRISRGTSGPGLGQGGVAPNGEVEDHPIAVFSPFRTSGAFGAEQVVNPVNTDQGVADVLAVDIDGDGRMDIISASHIDGDIAIFRANANFTSWTRTALSPGVTPSNSTTVLISIGLASGDLDGDGDLDLVTASTTDDTIAWWRNDSVGSTLSFSKFTVTSAADGARAVVVADFDRDGQLDLASASAFSNQILVHHNTGNGGASQFATAAAYTLPAGSVLADLYAVDIDRDGFVDLASVAANTNRVRWHENDGTPFVGGWNNVTTVFNGTDAINNPRGLGVFAGRIDGDAEVDLVVASYEENRVDWFSNTASGRNTVGTAINGASPAYVADIDGDGDMDVVVPAFEGDKVSAYLNNGSGTFSAPLSTGFFSEPTNVVVADINGDGTLDVVAGGNVNNRISWWPSTPLAAEMSITGNGSLISDGSLVPKASNGTSLGAVPLGTAGVTQTFAIANTGPGTLSLGNVTLPSGFTLATPPAGLVAPGESTTFTIAVDTSSTGLSSGQISIANNDSNENPYNFAIRATVVTVLGDYNLDQSVNLADYTVWRDTLGASVPAYTGADGNGDGVVNSADYAVWKSHFGQTFSAAVASSIVAAEPAAIVASVVWELATSNVATEQGTTSSSPSLPLQLPIATEKHRRATPVFGSGEFDAFRAHQAKHTLLLDQAFASHRDAEQASLPGIDKHAAASPATSLVSLEALESAFGSLVL